MSAPGPFGLYIHWPYCAAICPYCDFNVYRDRGEDRSALLAAIVADIAGWRRRTGPRPLASIHFGGGTPSRLAPSDVAALIDAANTAWPLADGAEVGIEINPEDARADLFTGYRTAGVNRVSLGVQAFDDAALKALGRAHSAEEARRAVEAAQAVFPRVSIDLIYAREHQTVAEWEAELSEALRLRVPHLSLYQLTVEPGTAFARRAGRGALTPPEPDAAADLYERTQDLTAAAGYPAYEVSNHASGPAAQSRHNLLYWRSQEWAGVGPGAHGRLGPLGGSRRALSAFARPDVYIDAVHRQGWGVEEDAPLSAAGQAREVLLMGLRLEEGLDLARCRDLAPGTAEPARIAALEDEGLLIRQGDRVRATRAGRLLTDRLALELAPPG